MDKSQEYAVAVADAILSLFRDEEDGGNPNYHYDLENLDATEFFTSMVIGCNLVFAKLTNDEVDNIEFTHICNKLIVQHLLKDK